MANGKHGFKPAGPASGAIEAPTIQFVRRERMINDSNSWRFVLAEFRKDGAKQEPGKPQN